jgi:phospholipase D1/2
MDAHRTSSNKKSWTTRHARARTVAILKGVVILLLLFTLPALWSWTPLKDWINLATIIQWQESVKHYPDAFFLVVGAYLLGSLFFFPVTILNVATVLTFGPIQGNLYGLVGWLASAAMGYGVGRGVGKEIVKKVVRFWGHRVLEPAERHGFLTVLTLRVFPVAPFTLVNFLIGAARIRFWDFFLASVIGRIPGVILLTVAGLQVESLFREPGLIGLVLLGLTLVLVPLAFGWASRRLLLGQPRQPDSFKSAPKS